MLSQSGRAGGGDRGDARRRDWRPGWGASCAAPRCSRCRWRVVIALVNALVTRDGLTVIVRLGDLPVLGHTDVTLEATAYGGDPRSARGRADPLRRALHRRGRPRRGAAAVPPGVVSLGADARRWPPGWCRCWCATPGDWPMLSAAGRAAPPSRVALMRAASSGVLDRALDVAAALEVRGYGAARASARARRDPYAGTTWRSRRPRSSVLALAIAVSDRRTGAAPRLPDAARARRRGGDRRGCCALVACALLPFADRRGIGR